MKACSVYFLSLLMMLSFTLLQAQNKDKTSPALKELINDSRRDREDKDREFRNPEGTPLLPEDIKGFKGLKYFDFDPAYSVMAHINRHPFPVTFRMKTTTDRAPLYSHFADIELILEGRKITLEVYQNQDLMNKPGYADYLFLPFTDETSAEETYGGGRFLDLKIPAGDSILVDFNKAYNPYCAYNHRFSCPIPPKENHIPVRIMAGEKTYADLVKKH
jgi:uncharacterized protein